jgi:hypothetical protein
LYPIFFSTGKVSARINLTNSDYPWGIKNYKLASSSTLSSERKGVEVKNRSTLT